MDAYFDLQCVLNNESNLIALAEKYEVFRLVGDIDLKKKVINRIIDHLTRFLFCVTTDFELMKIAYKGYYILTEQQKFFTGGKPLVSLLIGNPGNFSLEVRSGAIFSQLEKIGFEEDIYTPNWMYISLEKTYFSCRHCNKIFLYWCCCMRAIKLMQSKPLYQIKSFCDPGNVRHWRPCFTSHVV